MFYSEAFFKWKQSQIPNLSKDINATGFYKKLSKITRERDLARMLFFTAYLTQLFRQVFWRTLTAPVSPCGTAAQPNIRLTSFFPPYWLQRVQYSARAGTS